MQIAILSYLTIFIALARISTCRLVLPNLFRQAVSSSFPYINQAPIMPVIPSDETPNNPSSASDKSSHGPTLYDTLALTRRINIFSSLIRDHPNLPILLSNPASSSPNHGEQSGNFTILAPLNSALQSLPHKPWEDGNDYAELGERAYDGEGGQERAKQNLKRFVDAHIVPKSPWQAGQRVKTLAGKEVWWEEINADKAEEKKRVIMPSRVEVEAVVSQVENGEILVLKGVLGP